MSTFVLVHGAWHGGWVWDKVATLLRQRGHVVHAPDLPGHGSDKTPVGRVTLQVYADRVCEVMDSCPEPAFLVGHSMGGVAISQAAEQRPDRVAALAYVCAFLLQDGECLVQWAEADHEALVPPNFVFSSDKASVTLKPEGIAEALYGDCRREEVEQIRPLLAAQATAPLAAPVRVTPERFGRIPRVYVECLRDRAISIAIQRAMYQAAGCERVFTLDCDHSPMFSCPNELAACLDSATQIKAPARS